MINTTDLSECEITLPGEWKRTDNGDLYSFTVDHMKLEDERLFKQLKIHHVSPPAEETLNYALMIKGDYCGVVVGEKEFIIKEITKKEDGSAYMEWEDERGKTLRFSRA